MKLGKSAVIGLLLLATCNEEPATRTPTGRGAARVALGKVSKTELAVWQKVAATDLPDARYLQATAFDETRKVLVMFGGADVAAQPSANQDLWEWSPTTRRWNKRNFAYGPSERYGAAMVFDAKRNKLVLFGGRSNTGSSLDDTWEWDPATNEWTELGAGAAHPTARTQVAMAYERSTGRILLFGGCRRENGSFGELVYSLDDTWEYDPVVGKWQSLSPASAPSARYDAGIVWDSSRDKAVLFGGIQADGALKQDFWEWEPTTGAWSERIVQGSKPSQRYGHAMAFDGKRGKLVLFGGQDELDVTLKNDLWEWDAGTAAWTQRLTGSEAGLPSARMYASLVANDADARLLLLAGVVQQIPNTKVFYPVSSRELWEIDPVQLTFTERTVPTDYPPGRYGHAMAYYPPTGKTYVFGGCDNNSNQTLGDFWAWDGETWSRLTASVSPPARLWSAMAYDPARQSLILYGGARLSGPRPMDDIWEWTETTQWSRLQPATSPGGISGHTLITDAERNKVLLFQSTSDIWEWDGNAATWSKRAPIVSAVTLPAWGQMTYDEGRQKVFVYTGNEYGDSPSEFWEWDPFSAGWVERDSQDPLGDETLSIVAYDSRRRRQVVLTADQTSDSPTPQTWEVDTTLPTWYQRTLSRMPGNLHGAAMAFDSARNVIVFFGGEPLQGGAASSETWEYQVSNLDDGEGCTPATPTSCASGNCVDGVCCAVAVCMGTCMSCKVPGSEGTCAAVPAGVVVPGSCPDGLACDGNGGCRSQNGQACTAAADCASGFCADGVCCEAACAGACVACNLPGRAGRCAPYQAGTDPESECGQGSGVCKSTCDGVGACAFPKSSIVCDTCLVCDGYGSCSSFSSELCNLGGMGGSSTGIGGTRSSSPSGTGGIGPDGGAGVGPTGGAGGASPGYDGGVPRAAGGAGGSDGTLLSTNRPLGTGGIMPGTGGVSGHGSSGKVDAGSSTGGRSGILDAASDDPRDPGCDCALGTPSRSMPGMTSLVWLGLWLARRRRR